MEIDLRHVKTPEEARETIEAAFERERVPKASDPFALTPAERSELLTRMEAVAHDTYWLFFRRGMGSECHAFLEFNGLISKFVGLCRKAHEQGIDFTQANTHTGKPLPLGPEDARYMAEKLECIFGPALRANPKALRAFLQGLGLG